MTVTTKDDDASPFGDWRRQDPNLWVLDSKDGMQIVAEVAKPEHGQWFEWVGWSPTDGGAVSHGKTGTAESLSEGKASALASAKRLWGLA